MLKLLGWLWLHSEADCKIVIVYSKADSRTLISLSDSPFQQFQRPIPTEDNFSVHLALHVQREIFENDELFYNAKI